MTVTMTWSAGRIAALIPAFAFLLISAVQTAFGQSADELSELEKRIAQVYQAGKYDEAASLADRIVELARQRNGENHPRYASALSWQAVVAQDRGQFASAETIYRRILDIDEKALGADHPDVGRDSNNLALVYQDMGRYAEAEPLFERALAIAEKQPGPKDATLAVRLHNLASLYRERGRLVDAEPLLKRALAIQESLSPESARVATTLGVLGKLYRDMARFRQDIARYAEAERVHKR
ncbi:MAG: tetratricopeptide repeat protein, partial [Hyphomicrobiaceae bacterium]